jgi:hypothetical protein
MKRYQCTKQVNAVKLADVIQGNEVGFGLLIPHNTAEDAPIKVEGAWIIKHSPSQQADGSYGYYVVYEDGYASWSPTKAFEEGYTEISA